MRPTAPNLIAIGGSAGAYELIVEILDHLPSRFTEALVIVLHRHSKYETKIESSLSKRLNRDVLSIRDKMPILPNHIYFAPPGYHTLVEPGRIFSLDVSEPVQFSRPSIDVFFETAAAVYQNNCVAMLLSGANSDGANGFRSLIHHGATCYVQDPREALIETMPQAGLDVSDRVKKLNHQETIDFFCHRLNKDQHEND
ncbi:MAG: chemotaxis protein CheB [Sphingobacterium sp.]